MADGFLKQAKEYSDARPTYPPDLIQFIASYTPSHDLAWDAGTGSGQAARSLAEIYKNVIATDTSQKQLDYAPKLPNVRYQCTSPTMSMAEIEQYISSESSVDLVTIATALHYFDLTAFYQQVRWVLKKPHGVIAAWTYFMPEVNPGVDSIVQRFISTELRPYWKPEHKLVIDKYKTIDFPFEPVDGHDNTEPIEFKSERLMDLDGFFTLIKSWSVFQRAKDDGVEPLKPDVVEDFKRAWNEDGKPQKVVNFPTSLRIGKVGNLY